MEYEIIKEDVFPNGFVLQIIKTKECGGRYYLVTNGMIGFHSLDFERVEDYYNDIAKSFNPDKGQSR